MTRHRTRVERGIYLEHTARGARYIATYTDGAGRQRTTSRPTLDGARLARSEALVDRARGVSLDIDGARMTLLTYAAIYSSARVWRPNSRARFDSMLAGILSDIAARELGTLRPTDVRRVIAVSTAAGYAPSTIAAAHALLSSLLESATVDRYIPANPARGVKPPQSSRSAAAAASALDAAQLEQLLAAFPDWLRTPTRLMAATGLRPSEAAGLTVDRVDFLRRRITVDRQLAAVENGSPVFGPPKTPSSVRVVAAPASVIDALAVLAATPGPEGLLFVTRRDTPWTRTRRSDAWQRAARKLTDADTPLPAAARGWHTLRHTYASNALAAGVPLITVSRNLGHRSTTETQATYSHLLISDDLDAHADTVAAALGFA